MGRKGTPAATRAVVAERRGKAIEMRHAGVDTLTIGRQLKYGTWREVDGEPVQITADGVLARLVRQDISRGLADRRNGLDTAVTTMRQEQTERLERLRAAVWAQAIRPNNPNLGAVREVVAIERQIAQLWGLATPVKQHVELGAASAEVEAAVVELVRLVHDTAEGAPLRPAKEA